MKILWATEGFCGPSKKVVNVGEKSETLAKLNLSNFGEMLIFKRKKKSLPTKLGNFGKFTAVKTVICKKIFVVIFHEYCRLSLLVSLIEPGYKI